MRLATFTLRGVTRLGAMLDETRLVDLEQAGTGMGEWLPAEMPTLLDMGDEGLETVARALDWAREAAEDEEAASASGLLCRIDEPGFKFEAPVPRPGKALAIGLNYRAHAEETGAQLPEHPIVFTKVDTSLCGSGTPIQVPRASALVDWEGEFCFVIGKPGRHISRENALDHVAGWTIGNDVSVRDWQRHAATWTLGKGFDTHGPMGPFLVTRDEVPDPRELRLQTFVNDVEKQNSGVDDLIFDVPALIEYMSTAFTLRPGDVCFTGTPSGVGQARNPREWLKAGDTVRVTITGLGELVNPVIDEPA